MTTRALRLSASVVALVAAAVVAPARAAEPAPIRRIGFIVGANDGGREHVRLRYAESDAMAFAQVLERLGGVTPTDRLLLLSPDKERFLAGLDELDRMLRRDGGAARRTELVVYYSGHSDEDGLLLGDDLLTYVEFRRRLEAMPADVRIAVLDSCASGAMTRHKGGTWRPPFMVDDSSQVQGHATLTSSAENESAQESDRIGGSFFTHYLVSGLRGAADTSRDGRVTLSEAYQFAFDETLARTEQTQSGAQHPAFDIQLSGTGDLVMTDLRGSGARLLVDADVDGRLYLRGQDGHLAAELRKSAGRAVELGLDGGAYTATLAASDGALSTARVAVPDGGRAQLTAKMFGAVPRELAVARGGTMVEPIAVAPHEAPGVDASPPGLPPLPSPGPVQNDGREPNLTPPGPSRAARTYSYEPLVVSLLPDLCALHDETRPVFANVSLQLVGGHVAVVDGVQAGLGGAFVDEHLVGLQLSPLFTWVDGDPTAKEPGGVLLGAQLAGLWNYSGARLVGAQAAGLSNVVKGVARGVQLAGGANFAFGEGRAFDDAGLPAGSFAAQLAGGLNLARGPFYGVQVAGGVNVIQAGVGDEVLLRALVVQLAGGLNLARGDVAGAQLAAVNVVGDRLSGLQVGVVNANGGLLGAQVGLVNVGGDVKGLQLGLVNIAREVKGVQLGLVNLSDEITGVPFGLVSYSSKGQLHADLWMTRAGLAAASLKVGGRWLYSMGTVTFQRGCACGGLEASGALFGLGVRLPLGDTFFASFDASGGTHLMGQGPSVLGLSRLAVGFQPFEHLGVYGGLFGLVDARRESVGSMFMPDWAVAPSGGLFGALQI